MRLSKPNSTLPGALVSTLRGLVVELVSIAREVVRIPAEFFMRVAEIAGAFVLRGWGLVWPVLERGYRAGAAGLAYAERELTPARAAVVVTAGVALILAASQFAEYRSIAIGAGDYSEVDSVVAAPPVESADAGSAHLWVGIPLAVLALAIVAGAALGRWRLARVLVAVGVAVVALSLVVDMPKGLDEGNAAIAYQGAEARLVGGFWMQLACGAVLIAMGFLLTRLLEPRARAAAAGAPRRVQSLRASLPGGVRKPSLPRRRVPLGATREARS